MCFSPKNSHFVQKKVGGGAAVTLNMKGQGSNS